MRKISAESKKRISAVSCVVVAILILCICVPNFSKEIAKKVDIDDYRKSVGMGPLVTTDGITETDVKLTGSERTDIINVANSQLGVVEDYSSEAEFYTKYNKWYWEFVNIKDGSGKYLYDPWGWREMEVKKTAWCYFFLGWAADVAECKMTVYKANPGFFVDGQVARTYNTGGDPGWFLKNNRAIEIKSTADVINKAVPGDLIVGNSSTGIGNHHIFMIAENNGSSVKTIEGNLNTDHPRVVASRTMSSGSSKIWNNLDLLYICKPMYRSTATFYTNGAIINNMPQADELWFDTGEKKGGQYYKYKFFEDYFYYDNTQSEYHYTELPTEKNMTYEGYSFGGWYDNPEFAGEPLTRLPNVQNGNISLYARWEKMVTTAASSSVTKTQEGIDFYKKASWTIYEGSNLSENGNPYVKIEFEIDPTEYFLNNPDKDKVEGSEAAYFADQVPTQMDLVMGIYSEFERISVSEGLEFDQYFYTTDKKLMFRFVNGIENKTYKASFILEVDKSELKNEIVAKHEKMLTNGNSTNAGNDAIGSSYLVCDEIFIELSSPQLTYTVIEEGTEGASSNMRVGKSAKFGMVDGSYYDENGNPYIDIEFEIDMSGVSSDDMQKTLKLVDYMPKEYEYVEGSLEVSGEPTSYIYNSAKNTIECSWEDDTFGLQGKVFYVRFKEKLLFRKVDMALLKENMRVYTNGTTIDITKKSEGAATIKSTSFDMSLSSPTMDFTGVLSKIHKVTLHPNGGYVDSGAHVTQYTEGVGAILPTQMDTVRDGYTFAGWYDNAQLFGKPITMIGKTEKGDKEFWAKWVDQSIGGEQDGVEVSKVSKWEAYNGSLTDDKGNPYVKTSVTIDMTNADLDAVKSAKGCAESMDVVIAFEQSTYMRQDKLASVIEATKNMVSSMLLNSTNIRIAIAGYAGSVNQIVSLKDTYANDAASINAKIDAAYAQILKNYEDFDKGYYSNVVIGNNVQSAILWAQREFTKNSTADRKEFVLMTTRLASEYVSGDTSDDVVKTNSKYYNYALSEYYELYTKSTTTQPTEYSLYALGQMEYAKELIPNLSVHAVGIGTGVTQTVFTSFLESMATESIWGDLQQYHTYVYTTSSITIKLAQPTTNFILGEIVAMIKDKDDDIVFVDYVPDAYTVLKDTITVDDSILSYFNTDRNVLECEFEPSELEQKVYVIDFYSVLNLNKVPSEIIENGGEIYTNGKTLDVTTDSLGSAYFAYGENKIDLESPRIMFNPDSSIGNIGFVKDAKWGTYKGGKVDKNGNPYVTTSFKLDLTETNLTAFNSVISHSGATDIVFLVDVSKSMSDGKLQAVVKQTQNAVTEILNTCKNARVAVAGYGGEIRRVVGFNDTYTNDPERICTELESMCGEVIGLCIESQKNYGTDALIGATDVQGAIIWGQRQFTQYSKAENKLMVILSDGRPTDANFVGYTGDDVVKIKDDFYYQASGEYEDIKYDNGNINQLETMALAQKEKLLYTLPEVEIITMGVEVNSTDGPLGPRFISALATKDENGQRRTYNVQTDELSAVFETIIDKISKEKNFKIIDKFPKEYTLMEDSIITSDEKIEYVYRNGELLIDLSNITLQKKVYTIQFNTKLNKSMVPASVISSKGQIYTNGDTIDVTKDSTGSAYIEYDGGSRIDLESPKVSFADTDIEDSSNIKINKSARWGTYNEKTFDSNGNPYVKTTFSIDMTNVDLTSFKKVTSNAQSMDFMFLLDCSSSMRENKLSETVKATRNAIKEILTNNNNARISIKVFGGVVEEVINFEDEKSNDAREVDRQLMIMYGKVLEMYEELDKTYGVCDLLIAETDIQDAIIAGQREFLATRDAVNQNMLILTDGVPYNSSPQSVANDIVKANTSDPYYYSATKKFTEMNSMSENTECMVTLAQMEYAKEKLPNMTVTTVGVDLDVDVKSTMAEVLMRDLASLGEDGKPLFYNTSANIVGDIDKVFTEIVEIKQSLGKAVLTDLIPEEYIILEDTVVMNNDDIEVDFTTDRIIFDFSNVSFIKKVYTIEFYTALNITKVPMELQKESVYIYSNGTTLYTTKSSLGSSYFEYGANGRIDLESPKLLLDYQAMIDRVSVTKTAKWGEYDGQSADSDGNLYSEIEFKVDLSEADVVNLKQQHGTTDVVLLLDFSQSMRNLGALDSEVVAAMEFAEEFLGDEPSDTRRLAVAAFEHNLTEIIGLNDPESNWEYHVNNLIGDTHYDYGNITPESGTDMQGAIVWAQRQLINYSKADNKVIMLLSDGMPSWLTLAQTTTDDIVDLTDEKALSLWDRYENFDLSDEDEAYVYNAIDDVTNQQMDYAKNHIEGLSVVTMGIEIDRLEQADYDCAVDLFSRMSTVGPDGEKMFYEVSTGTAQDRAASIDSITINSGNEEDDDIEGEAEDIEDAFADVLDTINGLTSFRLVDIIPEEYEFVEDSLEIGDSSIQYTYENNRLVFKFDLNNIESKTYTFKFNTKLILQRIPDDILNNNDYIYTNGTTVDVTKDSLGSAYFTYGGKKIELESPKLLLDTMFNVILHTNGGVFEEGKEVTKYLKGVGIKLPTNDDIHKTGFEFIGWFDNEELLGDPITEITESDEGDKEFWAKWKEKNTKVTKTATWASVDGKTTDAEGNPYAQIEFNVDLTSMDLDEMAKENTSVDVCILMDYSSSMELQEGYYQYTAVSNFAKEFLTQDNRRIAVAGFRNNVRECVSLNTPACMDADAIDLNTYAMFNYYNYGDGSLYAGTDMQGALIWAQRQFTEYSTADKKVIILMSDGEPSVWNGNKYTGEDVIPASQELIEELDYIQNVSSDWTDEVLEELIALADAQAKYAKEHIEGLEIISVSVNLDDLTGDSIERCTQLLKSIATVGANGKKNFYDCKTEKLLPESISAQSITIQSGKEEDDEIEGEVVDLIEAMGSLSFEIESMLNIRLVDFIPPEFQLLEETLFSSDLGVQCDISEDRIVYTFDYDKVENKVYTFRFVTKLVSDYISEDIYNNCEKIYTNGSTIDSRLDSLGSSYLQYGKEKIELESPSLVLDFKYNVTLHTNGGTILAGKDVTEYKRGIITFLPTADDIIKNEYAFVGWFDNEECIGTPITHIPADSTGDKEYWAKWKELSVIKVKKTAEWTSFGGGEADAQGNPYTQISFEVDLTKADRESYYSTSDITTDVVLLVDSSKAVWDQGYMSEALTAANTFAQNLMIQNANTRIAVGMFAESVYECTTFEDNSSGKLDTITNKMSQGYNTLNDMYSDGVISSKRDIQGAIIWAQRQLVNYSEADKKVIIVFSNGEGNVANCANDNSSDVINMFTGINVTGEISEEIHEKINTQTVDQAEYAKNEIEGLAIISVGMGLKRLDEHTEARSTILMHNLASIDNSGERMFYMADVAPRELSLSSVEQPNERKITINAGREDDDLIIRDEQDTDEVITFMIEDILQDLTGTVAIRLVDKIPEEFGIFKSSIVKSDNKVITKISGNTVQFVFPVQDVEEKVYTFTFTTKLFMDRISDDVRLNNDYIYTNGTTIDVNKDSLGSSYVTYGKNGKIELESPKLELRLYHKVTLHPNGGVFMPGKEVTFYREGVGTMLPTGADITKEHYDFVGWYDNQDLTGTPVVSIPPTEKDDKEYWAKWEPKDYPIILHPNQGIYEPDGMGEITKYTYSIGTKLPTGEDISRDGYDFAGWYDNEGLTGTPVTEIKPTDSGPKEFWAKWEVITITLEFDQERVYIAVGYDEITKETYKASDIVACVNEGVTDRITAYVTRGRSKTSKRICPAQEFGAFEEARFKLPDEIIEEVAVSKNDYFVYLHIMYGTVQRTVQIRVRACAAFEEY